MKIWCFSSIVWLGRSFKILKSVFLCCSIFSNLFFNVFLIFLSSFYLIINLLNQVVNRCLNLSFIFRISLKCSFHHIFFWRLIFILNPLIYHRSCVWLLVNNWNSCIRRSLVNFNRDSISTIVWRNSFLYSINSSWLDWEWILGGFSNRGSAFTWFYVIRWVIVVYLLFLLRTGFMSGSDFLVSNLLFFSLSWNYFRFWLKVNRFCLGFIIS